MTEPWTHKEADLEGVRLRYVEAGAGPLVVLLHGFPDHWRTWRGQIPALAAAGLRVIAPDMRGYNLSGKPPAVEDYRINRLVEDVAGLIAHAGEKRAAVVGHDWGGGVAWATALARPELVDKLAIVNAPHPAVFARELRRPGQALRSWYMLFFQIPRLPEALIRAGDFAYLRKSLRRGFSRSILPDEELDLAIAALGRPGALTAALNYYRAAFRDRQALLSSRGKVAAPTLVLWGERDPYLGLNLTHGLEEWVPTLDLRILAGAGHWPHWERAEEVNRLLTGFLSGRLESL